MPKTSEKAAAVKVPAKIPGKGDHVFLVDGSSYIFRAYHALPPLNRKSDGLQVNAVLGFCNMLWKLLRDMPPDNRPTHLAIIFDKSEITFRNTLYPDYKARRPPAPDDLIPQFPLIREAVRAFDLPCLEQGGFEADDLIATYAREAGERGATATIVSSDKDLMQLVTDKVTMFDTMKDRRIGIAEVIEKFGVPPEKVVEVQALAGDSTDNVPGVPGIGIKTAAQLIVEYGDLETLLARAGEIKQPKRRDVLTNPDTVKLIRVSKQLVTLDRDVPVETPLEALATPELDGKRLVSFCKAMELTTLTRRVAEICGVDMASIEPDPRFVGPAAWPGGQGVAALEREGGAPAEGAPPAVAAPAPAPREPKVASQGAAPTDLASARAKEARAPIDRAAYKTVRPAAELSTWIARAENEGVVAVDAKTSSPDPLQAELIGLSLAVKPG